MVREFCKCLIHSFVVSFSIFCMILSDIQHHDKIRIKKIWSINNRGRG